MQILRFYVVGQTKQGVMLKQRNKVTLNVIFSDTNRIVSFKKHPHWTVIKGFEKAILSRQIQKKSSQDGLECKQKGCCFIRKMPQHASLWLQWLLCLTVSLNWLITPPHSKNLPHIATVDLCAGAFS